MLRVAREARMVRIGDSRKILSPAASFSAADSKFDLYHIFSPTCKKSLSRRFCPSYFPILTLHSCISVMLKWSAYFYWLAMSSVNACIFLYIQICFSVIWLTRRRSVNKYFHILWHLNLFCAQFCTMIVLYLWILIAAVNFRLRVKRFWKEKVSILKSSFSFVESECSSHVEKSLHLSRTCSPFPLAQTTEWKRMILMKDRPLEKWWKWQTEKW